MNFMFHFTLLFTTKGEKINRIQDVLLVLVSMISLQDFAALVDMKITSFIMGGGVLLRSFISQ